MKKIYYLIILTVILGLVLTGCFLSNVGQVPASEQSGIAYLTKGGPTESDADPYPLYAGQDWEVGQVLVWDDGEQLCVKYKLFPAIFADGWGITETHLAVGHVVGDIPQTKKGNPIPGQFLYGNDKLEGVDSWEICIPFDELGKEEPGDLNVECGDSLVIAAHAVVVRPIAECWDTMWQIGDVEETQMDNPCDEFNWPVIVTGPQNFYVDSTETSAFPWISRFNKNYAPTINIHFNAEMLFGGKLSFSWSPGASGIETLTATLDATTLGTITRNGAGNTAWWEKYERYTESFNVSAIAAGDHVLTINFTSGDGSVWDWLRLEKPCVQDETAWAGTDGFSGKNWATYFTYIPECECVEQLWQIGKSDGAVNPIDGSAEYPATGAYSEEYLYVVGVDTDPINAPSMPGYIGSTNVCDIDPNRPCTDTTMILNIQFDLYCSHVEGELVLIYDRYGSETDTLYFDFDGTSFATVVATEGGFKQFNLPLPAAAAGTHTITIAYEGGGDANGHYIDYLKLVEAE